MFSFLGKKAASTVGLMPPPAPAFSVPAALPKLTVQDVSELSKLGGFASTPQRSVPVQSPAQLFDAALNERQEAIPATKALAHALPEKERLGWAIESCEQVKDQLPEREQQALAAAGGYLAKPSPVTQELARRAAEQTDMQGPAGWAAKAASLSSLSPQRPLPPAVQAELAEQAGPRPDVVGHCIAGAVMLAAVLKAGKLPAKDQPRPTPPTVRTPSAPKLPAGPAAAEGPTAAEAADLARALKPFVERGLALAAG